MAEVIGENLREDNNRLATLSGADNIAPQWERGKVDDVYITSPQRQDVASTLKRRCINVMCPLECHEVRIKEGGRQLYALLTRKATWP